MVKKQIISVSFFLASVLFAGATVLYPAASLVTIFISLICFTFAVISAPVLWVIGSGSVLAFLVSWLISGSASAAMFFIMLFLPVGTALGVGFRGKRGFNDVMAFAALNAAILGVLTLIVFIGEFSGGSFDGREALMPVFQEVKDQMLVMFAADDPSVPAIFDVYGISAEQYVTTIYWSIVYNIPTFYMGFMMGLSVIGYWTVKAVMKRTTVSVSFMGRFDGCRISYAGAIIYFVTTLLYLFTSDSIFGIAISNFSNIMTYVFAYAGISLISYFLDFKNFSPFVKGVIMIIAFAVCLLPTGLMNFVALLGLVDSYWNIREKLKNSGF